MTQTKIDGKFYPLQNEEWLKATQELRYAEIRVLYHLRTIDPFGQSDTRIKVTDIANITGLKKGTVSKALHTLSEKGYINLEIVEAIVSINSFPIRNKVSHKKQSFLQETLTHHRKPPRTVGNDRRLEPASAIDSKPPKNNKISLSDSLSEEEREKFSAFCLKKASELPKPPVLVEKWISKHLAELLEAFKKESAQKPNPSKTTYTPEEIDKMWNQQNKSKNSFSRPKIDSDDLKTPPPN